MKQIAYISHPYRDDPEGNIERVQKYMKQVKKQGFVPIFTPLMWRRIYNDDDPKDLASVMQANFEVISDVADVVIVCGEVITEGMHQEIEFARLCKKPIIYYGEVEKENGK